MRVLSFEQHQFIAQLYLGGTYTQSRIAEMVGTSQGNVSKVVARIRERSHVVTDRRLKAAHADDDEAPRIFIASQLGSLKEPLNLDLA